ncbi:MAG: N-acetylmuramoyl-L-alanine amidase [Bacteroidales bacterium]|nr:N-acetylmuramoyl-L-alanine amidase [Bacteroidales bacterium]
MKRFILIISVLAAISLQSQAASKSSVDLKPALDSVSTLLLERSGIDVEFSLKNAMKRGSSLDLYFTNTFSDFPWREKDLKWFRTTLQKLLPKGYSSYTIANIYCASIPISEFVLPDFSNAGSSFPKTRFTVKDRLKSQSKGLQGRNIALWASHGLYFDNGQQRWNCQRPPLLGIEEGLLPRGYVMDYLIPMLANAGASVFCPRSMDVETIGESGKPRYCEGARANMVAEKVDSSVWYLHEGKDNYTDDFTLRGNWVNELKKTVPVDLCFALHTDAGVVQGDTIVGTLAIHTLASEGRKKFPDGESRMTSRLYADMVQTQFTEDVRATIAPEWTRRQLWNRSYSESRVAEVPSVLLEMLSHQNFNDMKYALDPTFHFIAARAIYKGILKYLKARYGGAFVVAPLPVSSFSARLDGTRAVLSWKETADPLEPTADPSSYLLYTAIDDGEFDNGKGVNGRSTSVSLNPGHIYRFKVVALNDGGRSFPSETLAVGVAPDEKGSVLVVNNFTRISGPDSFDSDYIGGFLDFEDSGVPYMREISRCGSQYCFTKASEFVSNDAPGFGASYVDQTGVVIPGNTFDYPALHGRAFLENGYSFSSCSMAAYVDDPGSGWDIIDLICGKQKEVTIGSRTDFDIFPESLREAITHSLSQGTDMIVSGSYIASCAPKEFTSEVLGYRLQSDHPTKGSRVYPSYVCNDVPTVGVIGSYFDFCRPGMYRVENPDGLYPYGTSTVVLRYADSGIPAAVAHPTKTYKTMIFGFPLELCPDGDLNDIISETIKYFEQK